MKAQQINLYPVEFREAPTVLPTAVMLRLMGLFMVVLSVLTGGAALVEWSERRAAEVLEGGLLQQRERLQALEIEVSKHLDNSGLETRLGVVRTELEKKRALAELLEEGIGRGTQGFSHALLGLGRQRVDGLWLTEFSLTDSGEHLSLQGRALSGALLIRYLQRLGGEQSFDGREFRTFAIERDENTAGVLTFDVRTDLDEPAP
jgi:hypothetical protein